MVIRGQGCLGYVDGSIKKPDPTYLSFSTWDAQNSMVMAWIANLMEEDIKEFYLCYSTAKEMWDALTLASSDMENSA